MSSKILFTLIVFAIVLAIDLYTFQALRNIAGNWSATIRKTIYILFWLLTCLALLNLFIFREGLAADMPHWIKVYVPGFFFIFYACKLPVVLFLLFEDIFRLGWWGYSHLVTAPEKSSQGTGISRSEFLSTAALVAGGIPFAALLYGMAQGAFQYTVRKVNITKSNLPKAFNGLKVVQISDLHLGTLVNDRPLKQAVKMINDLQPDVILFTGDLVNRLADEAEPFIEALSKLSAPYGVFSVLGNHDYGDYANFETQRQWEAHLAQMKHTHSRMGWKLLTDKTELLERAGEKIALIGMENWSVKSHFKRYGNTAKAIKGSEGALFKIMLSHDPTHWRAEILPKYKDIDLVLSGHTHGSQFGIKVPGWQWSPVQYVYDEWAGLYREGEQYLYVNRGIGTIGYPGRVGMWPEITLVTLNKE